MNNKNKFIFILGNKCTFRLAKNGVGKSWVTPSNDMLSLCYIVLDSSLNKFLRFDAQNRFFVVANIYIHGTMSMLDQVRRVHLIRLERYIRLEGCFIVPSCKFVVLNLLFIRKILCKSQLLYEYKIHKLFLSENAYSF